MVRQQQHDRLDAWLAEAEGCDVPALRRHAAGLASDHAAVETGLREPWSNGTTEGFVNKVKLIKRQASGRTVFAVLRQRHIRAASDVLVEPGLRRRSVSAPRPADILAA
jgi:transposase